MRNKLRRYNLDHIGKKDYDVRSAMVFNDLFSLLEKAGDHLINVTESVVGEI